MLGEVFWESPVEGTVASAERGGGIVESMVGGRARSSRPLSRRGAEISPQKHAKTWIAVCGPGKATEEQKADAREAGATIAEKDAVLVCGGLRGVMGAACEGAYTYRKDATIVGLLPGTDRDAANDWVTVAIPTGLGNARNLLIVRAADAVIAIGGEWGTLSEIALALKDGDGRPVVGVNSWPLEPTFKTDRSFTTASSGREAVLQALDLLRRSR